MVWKERESAQSYFHAMLNYEYGRVLYGGGFGVIDLLPRQMPNGLA